MGQQVAVLTFPRKKGGLTTHRQPCYTTKVTHQLNAPGPTMSTSPSVFRTREMACVEEVTFSGKDVSECHRYDEFDCNGMTNRQIVQKAKKMFGWTGIRCSRKDGGFHLTLKAQGSKCGLVLHKKFTYP